MSEEAICSPPWPALVLGLSTCICSGSITVTCNLPNQLQLSNRFQWGEDREVCRPNYWGKHKKLSLPRWSMITRASQRSFSSDVLHISSHPEISGALYKCSGQSKYSLLQDQGLAPMNEFCKLYTISTDFSVGPSAPVLVLGQVICINLFWQLFLLNQIPFVMWFGGFILKTVGKSQHNTVKKPTRRA